MAIFALVSVLLFVVAGLAVDAGTSYLTSNELERAAAPRLLPAWHTFLATYPDATNAALVEAARDGYPERVPASRQCVTVVLTSDRQTNEMKVTISVSVSTRSSFASLDSEPTPSCDRTPLNISHPYRLGQPGSQQGSSMNWPLHRADAPAYCAISAFGTR